MRFKTSHNVDDLPERGKTRAMTSHNDKCVIGLLQTNPRLTLRQVQKLLTKKKVKVSLMTIKCHLHKNQSLH